MAVPKAKRNLSNMEFFSNAMLLREAITELLLRVGVKDKIRYTVMKPDPNKKQTLFTHIEEQVRVTLINLFPP